MGATKLDAILDATAACCVLKTLFEQDVQKTGKHCLNKMYKIPTATCLREHYHIQMTNAKVVEDGKSGLDRSYDQSAIRMAKCRNVTQLAGQHTIRATRSKQTHPILKTHPLRWQSTTHAARKVNDKLHRTENKACKVATRQKQQTKHNNTYQPKQSEENQSSCKQDEIKSRRLWQTC